MNYANFKEKVYENFKEYLPERYKNLEIQFRSVKKVNTVLDGITFVGGYGTLQVSPTIYINDIFEEYQRTNDYEGALKNAANMMAQAMDTASEVIPEINMDQASDNIVFQLVNTEQNKSMLENIPNRNFHDLSIIYRWIVKLDSDGCQSVMMTNDLAEKMGMDEDQLYRCAIKNTKRMLPPVIKSMNEVLMGMCPELADALAEEIPPERSMWIITNSIGINGASSIVYSDELQKLAEKFDSDIYILPSSIHEAIAVSTAMGDPYELAEMVHDINMGQVRLEERLSNQVYRFDRESGKISLATNTSYGLDECIA